MLRLANSAACKRPAFASQSASGQKCSGALYSIKAASYSSPSDSASRCHLSAEAHTDAASLSSKSAA